MSRCTDPQPIDATWHLSIKLFIVDVVYHRLQAADWNECPCIFGLRPWNIKRIINRTLRISLKWDFELMKLKFSGTSTVWRMKVIWKKSYELYLMTMNSKTYLNAFYICVLFINDLSKADVYFFLSFTGFFCNFSIMQFCSWSYLKPKW